MKKYSLLIATLFLTILFVRLFTNFSHSCKELENNDSLSTNISSGDSASICNVLYTQNYVPGDDDAAFIAGFIAGRIKDGVVLSNLYDLNKRVWQIPASLIDGCGSSYYTGELSQSRSDIGLDEEFALIDTTALTSAITVNPGKHGEIRVNVYGEQDSQGLIDKLLRRKGAPCRNVAVRLSEQDIDTLTLSPVRITVAYAKTDGNGQVVFSGLDENLSYSVLPIREGFEYGTSKGTLGGSLAQCSNSDKGTLTCTFTQLEHKIRIFDALTLRRIKEDRALVVRSPNDFKEILTMYVALFFAAWWGLWLFSRRRKRRVDLGLLSILMTLTGICMLTMFSLNDPLTDKLLGVDMAQGIIAGVICIGLLQLVDFKEFYQNRMKIGFDIPLEIFKWIFKPFRKKVAYLTNVLSNRSKSVPAKLLALLFIVLCLPFLVLDLIRLTSLSEKLDKAIDRLPRGCGYLLTALLLTALLFTPLGVAVGGMKVNLNIGILFQPSEIAKYLIIIFMAAYFSVNADSIIQYSQEGNASLFGSKLKMLASIIIGLGVLMGIYLVLGDMGPALVLAFTFIIVYSIIKSKIDLDGLTPGNQLKQIYSCDLAMLLYGVLSFILFLLLGRKISNMPLLCVAWFIFWLLVGSTRKQVYETPILFNLIITAFLFGGSILGGRLLGGNDKLASVAQRLDGRIEMCTNTWGTLPIDGMSADAGQNTQVAEGLWGLATGGVWGQGLGNGSPHFIPAFHTDMILESMGEQMGFVGLALIILLLAVLLRKTIVMGYRTTHPFLFYLCTGIAVVTAVQFIIISLGSTGVIPLTGVTVPFLSYGKVSMILNLVAFGIILSITSHNINNDTAADAGTAMQTKRNMVKYNYTVSILSWTYCIILLIICRVFLYYQLLVRNDTLIRPVYVNNDSGIPVVQYNPRIEQLTDKMFIGDIYDRNGVLLATSDKTRITDEQQMASYRSAFSEDYSFDARRHQDRYYPFGAHLAFMLGDQNSGLFTFHSEKTGYSAETRHFSELRGYNRRVDKKGNELPIVILSSTSRQIDRWHTANKEFCDTVALLNYSALIPYLKNGYNSDRIERYNNRDESFWALGKIKPKDIHLTVDAVLQTRLQLGLEEIFMEEPKTKPDRKTERIRATVHNNIGKDELDKARVSVVVLDANKGDLLASANYPLPSAARLKAETVNNRIPSYRDFDKPKGWTSYTDMDLGLMNPTPPGSTAKVMSAIAGLRKLGTKVADVKSKDYSYTVLASQKVGQEPPDANHPGNILNMRDALVWSSNCYFINLVNDQNLYDDLAYIYRTVGARIKYNMPYGLFYSDSANVKDFYETISKEPINEALTKYQKYVEKHETGRMEDNIWQWAWGQGELSATPLTIARVASIVANSGNMTTTRFTLDEKTQSVPVISKGECEKISGFMTDEATLHTSFVFAKDEGVGGKTGTAQRKFYLENRNEQKVVDGWYMFYVKSKDRNMDDLAVTVRIEHGKSSSYAKQLARDLVMDILRDLGYVL